MKGEKGHTSFQPDFRRGRLPFAFMQEDARPFPSPLSFFPFSKTRLQQLEELFD